MEFYSDPEHLNQTASIEAQAELAGLVDRLLDASSETQTYVHYAHDYIARLGGEVIGMVRLQGGRDTEQDDLKSVIVFAGPNYPDDLDDKHIWINYSPEGDPTAHPVDKKNIDQERFDKAYVLATKVQDSLKPLSDEDALFFEILRLLNAKQFGLQTGYQSSVKRFGQEEGQTINSLVHDIIKKYTSDEVQTRNILSQSEVDDTYLYVGTYNPTDPLDVSQPYMQIERELSDGSRIQFKFDYDGNYARHITVGEHEDEFEYEEPTVWQLQLVYEAIEDKLRGIGEAPPAFIESEQVGEAPFRQDVLDVVEKFKIYQDLKDVEGEEKTEAWEDFFNHMSLLEEEFYRRYHLVNTEEEDGRPLELNLFVTSSRDGRDPKSYHAQFNKMAVNSPVFYINTEHGVGEAHIDSNSVVRLEFCNMAARDLFIDDDDEPRYDIYLEGLARVDGENVMVFFPMSTMSVVETAHLLN